MSDYGGQHRIITLTGWSSGTGFGLRVGAADRRRVFERLKKRMGGHLRIELPGVDELVVVNVKGTFWSTCPEFRPAKIDMWMKGRGDRPWPDRRPPKYRAELLTDRGRIVLRVTDGPHFGLAVSQPQVSYTANEHLRKYFT